MKMSTRIGSTGNYYQHMGYRSPMAEGRVCLSPGSCCTNLHPSRAVRRQKHAAIISNRWIGGGNSYGNARSENLLARLP
jgi:hypothetical protein